MFIYHIHIKEDWTDDPYKTDIYFQASDVINLHDVIAKMKSIVEKMNDEESTLYEEYGNEGWDEQVEEAFDMVISKDYPNAERIDVFTSVGQM